MNTKVDKYIKEFAKIANTWLSDRQWILDLHKAYKEFFKQENLEKADWNYFQNLRKLIHSFKALPLAGARALGKPNHPIEHYRKVFLYLKYGQDSDAVRFTNLIDKKSGYSLAYFGKSAMSELIGQAFPDKYVFYNSRDIEALKFLGFQLSEKETFGEFYIAYNDLILKEINPIFNAHIKTKFDEIMPRGFRIDQFFSWLYEEKIFKNMKNLENKDNVKPKGKITQLNITSFNQFKNTNFDFTYPKGHSLEGKALHKVCFIGQSGTGKTSLLRIIKELTSLNLANFSNLTEKSVAIHYRLADKDESRKIEYKLLLTNGEIKSQIEKTELTHAKKKEQPIEIESQIGAVAFPSLINFPAEIISSQLKMLEKTISPEAELQNEYSFKEEIIDFSLQANNNIVEKIWENLILRIQQYNEQVNAQKVIMADAILANPEKQKDILLNFEAWKKEHLHPIDDLYEKYLKKFLEKFNLKITAATESGKVFRFEPINSQQEIEAKFLSTGSQQIILRTLQFYSLWDKDNETGLPRNSIILMDEPENSLYPDVQREIVTHFEELTENCQFFYATHSPIIASSFEPYERFILKFDSQKNVIVEKGSAPAGTHFNDILYKEYDVETLGEKGKEMWKQFIELPNQILLETDNEKKQELMSEYLEIGTTYNFRANEIYTKK